MTKAEADLRDANEKELPEESYRVIVEQKRKELHDLMEQYAKENQEHQAKKANEQGGGERRHYERPSERRKRLEEQRHQNSHNDGHFNDNRYDHHEQQDAFQHFGGRSKRNSQRSHQN